MHSLTNDLLGAQVPLLDLSRMMAILAP
eukprot:COSAG02_NODE_43013_length_379_cov_0.560714_2_plen_27_part_01